MGRANTPDLIQDAKQLQVVNQFTVSRSQFPDLTESTFRNDSSECHFYYITLSFFKKKVVNLTVWSLSHGIVDKLQENDSKGKEIREEGVSGKSMWLKMTE